MAKYFKVVETDNFGGDYPNESFVYLPACSEVDARDIADLINSIFSSDKYSDRFWKVVELPYDLQPGFTP